jgi:DNA replication and repair protein RecF
VQGRISDPGTQSCTQLGLAHSEEGRRATINGLAQKQVSALAQHLPLQVISPDTHYEFRNSARHRRGTLDWGLFHVEPDFLGLWNRYQRILQQRNAALKASAQAKARHVRDEDLAITGEALHTKRSGLVARLKTDYQFCCQQLLGAGYEGSLIFESGWEDGKSLAECLRQDAPRDRARGFTHSGPHRADLRVELHSRTAQVDASHGQYKLLVIALRLAQIRNFIGKTAPAFVQCREPHSLTASRSVLPPSMAVVGPGNRHCCLLIDDLSAELDPEHRARLALFLSRLAVQLFVTVTEAAQIERRSWPSHKAFHVEQGTIEECA